MLFLSALVQAHFHHVHPLMRRQSSIPTALSFCVANPNQAHTCAVSAAPAWGKPRGTRELSPEIWIQSWDVLGACGESRQRCRAQGLTCAAVQLETQQGGGSSGEIPAEYQCLGDTGKVFLDEKSALLSFS